MGEGVVSGPDVEGVLAEHQIGYERRCYPSYVCLCGWDGAQGDNGSETDGQHDNADSARAHVAAALRAEVRAWLESVPWTETARDDILAALAEQVGQVAPSRVPGEGS
jgi:hypothetical protein